MGLRLNRPLTLLTGAIALLLGIYFWPATAIELPDPARDLTLTSNGAKEQTAVFAGGCFWGIQGVFSHVKGVVRATSGYAGGTLKNPDYNAVSSGTTGHAESVRVVYDPAQVSYGQLLKVFFEVAHDPTELNRQGPDYGTQYRSGIFTLTPDQDSVARAYIQQLEQAKVYKDSIKTVVSPLDTFYPAEDYHQDYLRRHPDNPYIVYNDLPKVAALKAQFPKLYRPD